MVDGVGDAVTGVMGKKFGGVPFPVILGVVGVGAYVGKKIIGNRAATAPEAVAPVDASTDPGILATQAAQDAGGVIYGGVGAQAGTGATSTVAPVASVDTQASWLLKAQQASAAAGFGAYEASLALRAYSNGNAITDPRQLQIINAVVRSVGEAPGLAYGSTGSESTRQTVGFVTEAGTPKIYEVNYSQGTRQWKINPAEVTNRISDFKASDRYNYVGFSSMTATELESFRELPMEDLSRGVERTRIEIA